MHTYRYMYARNIPPKAGREDQFLFWNNGLSLVLSRLIACRAISQVRKAVSYQFLPTIGK